MIDSHTHLNFQAFASDWKQVATRATAAGVTKMLVVGTDLASSEKAVAMAGENAALYATVGIHPHHAWAIARQETTLEKAVEAVATLITKAKVVAVGEVGLDYHWYRKTKYQGTQAGEGKQLVKLQKQLLDRQAMVALEFDKPLIIHSREAGEDVLEAMEHFGKRAGQLPKGVFHCFDGNSKYLKKVLAAGFYVSFTGNITWLTDRARAAQAVPLNRLLLETDCPYMKPGRSRLRAEPTDVREIARCHARMRGLTVTAVSKQTTANAEKLFKFCETTNELVS